MSSIFHGASNIRISGSPSFTIVNGGYHHYDRTKKIDKSQTATVSGNEFFFTNNVFGGEAPTENPTLQRRSSRPYPTESDLRQTRGVRTSNPNTNALHLKRRQPLPSNTLIELHPPAQTAPLLHQSRPHRAAASSGSSSYSDATFDLSHIQKMDEKTSANMARLMNVVRRDALFPDERDDQENNVGDDNVNDRPCPREDEEVMGSSDCVPPSASGLEECVDTFPYSSPIHPHEPSSFEPFLSPDESNPAEGSYLQDEDEDDDSWNHGHSYGPYHRHHQPEAQAEQNRPPPIPSHVASILRDLLHHENDNAASSRTSRYCR